MCNNEREQLKQRVQYEVWTVLYFPFIRLLGLPIVDIHIYTGDCYTGVTLRARGSILHRLQKTTLIEPHLQVSENQQREREMERGETAQEKKEEGR